LNAQLLPTPVFRDMWVAPGQRYTYRVTAVDLAGNESRPSEPVAAEVPQREP
jgi:fibronectin type 3 domain-containing protein